MLPDDSGYLSQKLHDEFVDATGLGQDLGTSRRCFTIRAGRPRGDLDDRKF